MKRDPIGHKLGAEWLLLASKTAPAEPQDGRYVLEVPMRLSNPLNGSHGHWRAKAKERTEQRGAVGWAWIAAGLPRMAAYPPGSRCPVIPKRVLITRIGKRELDDDNLAAACKSVRDSVAEMLGINDRMKIWSYAQEKSKEYGVRIEVWV